MKDSTIYLQALIDSSDYVVINKGVYYIKPLFLHSNMTLIIDEGVILKGIDDNNSYPLIETRVAGIDMSWYPALINLIDLHDVKIKGLGIIDGQGEFYWNKYWGTDMKGGLRKEYDKLGLRAFCDYDCKRPRNLLIQNSKNIEINDITLKDSGFWNLHILYSNDVIIDGIRIDSGNSNSPSTDGIDIDSSFNVIVKNSIISTNDDSICIKSGRDSSGIRKGIPSHDIEICNNTLNEGFGVTIGSELSGGIFSINIHDNIFNNTDCGFRIKSTEKRKGYVRDIYYSNNTHLNVKYLINIDMKWNPSYNNLSYDFKYHKPYYDILTDNSFDHLDNTKISNLYFNSIISTRNNDYKGISRCFNIRGFSDSKINHIEINDSKIDCIEYGIIENTIDFSINNTNISYSRENNSQNDEYDSR